MKNFGIFLFIFVLFTIGSCSPKASRFSIEGAVVNADSSILYLDRRELNKITVLDSVRLNKDGKFKFSEKALPYPEFYALRLQGQIINLAIDSTEQIKISADKNTFATSYKVDGSTTNEQIRTIALRQYDIASTLKTLQDKFSRKEINETEFIAELKKATGEYREITTQIIANDFKNPAAYFALFQKVNGFLFYDPYEKKDNKLFAAVATAWDAYYKDSPRTKHLHDYTLIAMKVRKQEEMNAEEVISQANQVAPDKYYEINLPDIHSQFISTSSLRGKVLLIDFTAYQAENSPVHNIILNKAYNKFKLNLEIYQVSFDADVHFWKNAAVNLPWISVHDKESINSELVFKYNIRELSSTYLFSKEGDLVKRLLPSDDIDTEIQKLL